MSIICISEQEKWILISRTSKNFQLTMMCTIFAKNNNVLIVQPAKNPTPLLISSTAQTSEPAVIFQDLSDLVSYPSDLSSKDNESSAEDNETRERLWRVVGVCQLFHLRSDKKLYVLYHMQWEQKKKQ